MNLVFYRLRRRPDIPYQPDYKKALDGCMADLKAYLEPHGATWVDVSDCTEIPLASYADGDHLAKEFVTPYTRFFSEQVAPYVR